jgi:hypothetical protein
MGNSNSIIDVTYNNTKLNLKDDYYILNSETKLYIDIYEDHIFVHFNNGIKICLSSYPITNSIKYSDKTYKVTYSVKEYSVPFENMFSCFNKKTFYVTVEDINDKLRSI